MRKLLSILLVAGMVTFVSCGSSNKDKLDKAMKLGNSEHYAEAITLCNEIIYSDPDCARAYFIRGLAKGSIAVNNKDMTGIGLAITDMKIAVKLDPSDAEASKDLKQFEEMWNERP